MSNQVGGGINQPYRFFNPTAQPFKPCKGCGTMIPANKGGEEEHNQEGGGISLPYRWFKPNATPFKPCANCNLTSHYNDFGRSQGDNCHGYNSCNMTGGCQCGGGRCSRRQVGGFPTHAPLQVFGQGQQKLKYNYDLQDNFTGLPVFDNVGRNHFF